MEDNHEVKSSLTSSFMQQNVFGGFVQNKQSNCEHNKNRKIKPIPNINT